MQLSAVLCVWAAMTVALVSAAVPTRLDLTLLREVANAKPRANHAISPFLVSNALSQVWLGARGTTRNEMGWVLGLRSQGQLVGYTSARRALSQASVTTGLYSRVYIKKGFSVKPSFLSIINRIYGTDVQIYSKPEPAAKAVNSDVAKVTRNRIKKIVTEQIMKHASLVLVAALYFKGSWKEKFETARPQPFLTPSGSRRVPMMTLQKRFQYKSFGDYDVVSLPYTDKDYSLLIFRPTQRSQFAANKLRQRVSRLNIASVYRQIRHSSRDVVVTMPKFKIETSYALEKPLFALGMRRAFTGAADLSGIARRLSIQGIIHKVFMEVNEEGTEAAGAVAIVIGITSVPPPPVRFTVDRPFLAVLYHNREQLNLFSAWVVNPK